MDDAGRSGLRLAEPLGALSMVTDLAWGHPAEEALRACLVTTGLAERTGLAGVEASTVHTHVAHIYEKTGVSTRAGAAVFAMENDLLPR